MLIVIIWHMKFLLIYTARRATTATATTTTTTTATKVCSCCSWSVNDDTAAA